MEKTIAMIMNETKMALVKTCNESRLPACILEMMVKDLYEELRSISESQLQQETSAYQQSLIENEEKIKKEPVIE